MVTVIHVLLFVLHVCVLHECEGASLTAMLVWGPGGGVVVVSAYMGGTRGSRVLSSACDVLEMSVVTGVGRLCDMCMCLARGRVGGDGGLSFTNPGGTGGKWDMYDWKIYSISNKSTKPIQVQLYTIAKKTRHEVPIFKGRVKGKERNGMAAIWIRIVYYLDIKFLFSYPISVD